MLPDLRYSLMSAFVLILSYFIHRNRIEQGYVLNDKAFFLLIAISLLMVFITPFAYNSRASWVRTTQFFKYLIIYFFMVKIITNINQYKVLLYTIVLNFLYLGYNGLYYFSGNRLDGVGVVDATDANLLAAFIIIIIPFLLFNFFWG